MYQTSTFEAERQSFYDNEQHLKSRIQSLSQARKQPIPPSPSVHEYESEAEPEEEEPPAPAPSSAANDIDNEPPEVTALKLELSTLSTSYTSIQNTLVLLQSQLIDLKRVNQELQEENESYNILLRERTLTGQFDLSKQLNGAPIDGADDDPLARAKDDDAGSTRSASRSLLDPVHETPEGGAMDPSLVNGFDVPDNDSVSSGRRLGGRHARRLGNTGSASHSPARGETLADLPITGPGLDLAAELGRAENKDSYEPPGRRSRKASSADRKPSTGSAPQPVVDALRNEVKALKDANKALSLYASKILDRIIATEGFEHVLAVDYNEKVEPAPAEPTSNSPPPASKKPRPQSVMVGRTVSNSSDNYPSPMMSPTERLTTFDSIRAETSAAKTPATTKASRRSMSFDWKGFSVFGGAAGDKKPENPNLRPLTLKAGGNSVLGARKLDTEEDDDDRRERERLNATMKLMGIEKPVDNPAPIIDRSLSSNAATPTAPTPSRFSFFRRSSVAIAPNNNSEQSSVTSVSSNTSSPHLGGSKLNLTQEALEQAEVEHKIAQLDARERTLSVELASGSGSGFTEIRRTPSRREKKSDERSSGSTIWSAGMSQSAHGD